MSLPEGAKARLGKGRINDLLYSPDSKTLAVTTAIGIWLYDTETYKEISLLNAKVNRYEGIRSSSIIFSADSQILLGESENNIIYLWDVTTGQKKQILERHKSAVRAVTFSLDGDILVSGSQDTTIRLWDADTGEHKQTIKAHTDAVYVLTFSSDGKTLASGSMDGTVLLWDFASLVNSANAQK